MDFFDYGHSVVDLVNPQFAVNAWHDIDKDELVRRLDKIDDKPWVPLNHPQTPDFAAFVNVIDEVRNESTRGIAGLTVSRLCGSAGNDTGKPT